jgi:hypothetical protein
VSEQFSGPKGDPVDHYWLVQSMAKATGVDLVAATDDGTLAPGAFAAMVERCRGCGWEREGGGCSRWLSLQVPGEAKAPKSCVNQKVFAELSAD